MEVNKYMEITANALQTVSIGANVQFTDTAVNGNNSIMHRQGSGLVMLRGLTNQCKARFRVSFGGNLAVPEDYAPGAISVAIAINGEPVETTTMTVTPAAIDEFFNVYGSVFLSIPSGCCANVSVRNTSNIPIEVRNANLIVERVA